ncbi:MAG: FtsX-like permease family protein [Gemmatimonadetes bacterium]|nr:FtsX-like permease family protein [Gemmatimonadota bacterium]
MTPWLDRLRAGGWRDRFGGLGDDWRVAGRRLRRSPGFAAANLGLLALGVGATLVLGGIARGVVLRPLPLPEPEQLFSLAEENPGGQVRLPDYPTFREWQAQSSVFRQMAFIRGNAAQWTSRETTERLLIGWVSPEFFPLLGRAPMLGRAFGAGTGERVAVVTHRFWRERLGADPAVVGRVLTVDALPVEIIGVMPRGVGYPTWAEIWMPFEAMPPAVRRSVEQRGIRADGRLVGRLRDGVVTEEARAAMAVVAARQADRYPVEQGDFRGVRLVPLLTESLQSSQAALGDPRQPLRYVAAGLALLLLITIANLANLAVARTAARAAELELRGALGAGRGRLIRLVAIETAAVALVGGLLGCVLGVAGIAEVRRRAGGLLPRAEEIGLDPVLIWATLGLVMTVVMLVGVVPTMLALRSVGRVTGSSHRVAGNRAHHRLRRGLVVVQIAFAVIMAIGASLVTESLVRSLEVPLGFEPDGLATALVEPNVEDYGDPSRLVALYRQLALEFKSIPGITATGLVSHAPLVSGSMPTRVLVGEEDAADAAAGRPAMFVATDPDYFTTAGIPVRKGRLFEDADLAAENGSLIVNEGFAARLWPGRDPIGQRIGIFRSVMGRADFGQPIEGRIVGVVGDVRHWGAEIASPDMVYVPFTWNPWRHTQLVVRGSPAALVRLVPTLETSMRRLHPELATRGAAGPSIQTFDRARQASELPRRLLTWLIVGFGAAALALVSVGLYAVISYLVGQRSRELGVRLALGATRQRVALMVLGDVAGLVGIGLVVGLAVAFLGAEATRGLVFGVGPRDPMAYGVGVLILTIVALAASVGPAWRAADTDLTAVLRGD